MATFGEKLKNIRFHLDLSQEEMGKLLGTSKQNISRYENNQNSPRLDTVAGLSNKLGIELTYLINDDWSIEDTLNALDNRSKSKHYYLDPGTRKIAEEIYNNKELSLLFDAARDASPEDLETAHTILKALKDKENKND